VGWALLGSFATCFRAARGVAAGVFALCSRASSETGYLFGVPKKFLWGPKSSATCLQSSRHVRIERKRNNNAGGLDMLLTNEVVICC
jgi:hypothetical protein